jgi:predicted glycoside hydrolase/deacetylase ChbG (UPF0249 family)
MAFGSTRPLTEMSTTNHPADKGRPARGADPTASCEQTVQEMWKRRRFTTLWASTASYRDSHHDSHMAIFPVTATF